MVLKGYYETNFQPDVLSHGSGRRLAAPELSLCSSSAPARHRQDAPGTERGQVWHRDLALLLLLRAATRSRWVTGLEAPGAAGKVHGERFPACVFFVSICSWLFPAVRDKMGLCQDGCLRQGEVVFFLGARSVLSCEQLSCCWQQTVGFSIRQGNKKKKKERKGGV